MDVSELSSVLDGCGRRGAYDKAFDACDSLDFTEASAESQEYADRLIETIEPAFQKMKIMDSIQVFVLTEQGLAGNTASAIVRYLGDPDKPVIGMTITGSGRTDVSSRGTERMISNGLNLAEAMRTVCASVGGQGGGHIIAAGGTIPAGTEEEFIKSLDAFIGNQFAN